MDVTHPEKVLYPADGITKGDVVNYYQRVADRMLPHLAGRPLTLQRFPQGINRPGFMQKNAGKGFPNFIGRVELPKQDGTVAYPVVFDVEGLLYLANQNTITFHISSARAQRPDRADRLVFDLDPSENDAAGARLGAKAVRDLLGELDLPCGVMTTGSKGYHVVTPIQPTVDYERLSRFAQAVAHLIVARHPAHLTTEFLKRDREGRVFVDWLRNHWGATGVCPYSLRPRPRAPVATPISWRRINQTDPDSFTISNLQLPKDPWANLASVDVEPALGTVERILTRSGIELPAFDRFGR